MDKKTVFVKTNTGESEVNGQSDALYGDVKRILHLVDNESTIGDISKRAPPSLRESLNEMLQELLDGGYIRDRRATANVPQKSILKMASPAFKMAASKVATPSIETQNSATTTKPIPTMPPDIKEEERAQVDQKAALDFSFITSTTSQSEDADGAAKEKAPAEAMANIRQEADRLKAEQSAQIEAFARAVKLKAYEEAKEKAKFEVAARARIEAETRGKNKAEATRLKAEQEVLKTRSELAATQAKVEAEVRARIEAEARIKQEVEAARLKAEREAEKIRLELEAAKAKAEMEMRNRLEAEARAKADVEARLKREAEAERLRIEKERAELEVARIKVETEKKMRVETEMRVRAEVEERVKREEEAERLRIEKERAELEVARVKAEAEIKMRAEAEIRIRAEVEARLQAEGLAQHDDQSNPHQDTLNGAGVNPVPGEEEQIDPAEKLRQSFVKSFGQGKEEQESSPLNFKLDTFSLTGSEQKTGATVQPKKSGVPPGGGSRVKAALEQRAQKEVEAQRIKAEQEAAQLRAGQEDAADVKAKQEAAAAHIAEQDSIRMTAEHEAYRLKTEQEVKRAKAEAEAEAEAQKLSDQQAKQWEDAQRRAASQAQAETERVERQSAEAQIKSRQKRDRAPRKPLPIGKMVAGLFVLVLIAVVWLPYVWPLDEYIAPLEKEISAQLNQPVHINKIHFTLLPLPRLELRNLTMGSGQELKVGDVVFNFDLSALFASTKSINSMELSNVTLAGASLDKVLFWLQAVGGNEKYPVTRLELRGVQVMSDEIKLPLLNGRADFDGQGKFTKADLKSEDGKFGLELQSLQNRLQLELNIHQSSLPVLPDIKFNDLSVNGVLKNGEVIFSDLFAHIHGGTLTGKGQLNWSHGWKLQGQINAKSLELQSMFPNFGVTGQLYGDVNVSMYGSALSKLDKDPRIEGTFEAKNGTINKLDIDTMARFGSRLGTSGRTNFSDLTGTLKADNRSQRFYLNKIAAGGVSGNGLFDVDAKQQLSGKLLVDIKGDAKGSVTLQLSGSLKEPLLQPGR